MGCAKSWVWYQRSISDANKFTPSSKGDLLGGPRRSEQPTTKVKKSGRTAAGKKECGEQGWGVGGPSGAVNV